jgi:hypothetical protein
MRIMTFNHRWHWRLYMIHRCLHTPSKILRSHDLIVEHITKRTTLGRMVAMFALQRGEWGEGGVGCGVVMWRETIVRQGCALAAYLRAATVVRSAKPRSSLRTATVVRRTAFWPRKNIVDGAALDCLDPHQQDRPHGYMCYTHSIESDSSRWYEVCSRPYQSFLIITSGETECVLMKSPLGKSLASARSSAACSVCSILAAR